MGSGDVSHCSEGFSLLKKSGVRGQTNLFSTTSDWSILEEIDIFVVRIFGHGGSYQLSPSAERTNVNLCVCECSMPRLRMVYGSTGEGTAHGYVLYKFLRTYQMYVRTYV